jgi:hypothetical protein
MELYRTPKMDRGTALRLRLGDMTVENRPIEAELREAMESRLAGAEQADTRKKRRNRKG